jgi:hypothetical protein
LHFYPSRYTINTDIIFQATGKPDQIWSVKKEHFMPNYKRYALFWFIMNFCGSTLGWTISSWLEIRIDVSFEVLFYLLAIGLSLALTQWLVIRKFIPKSSWWPIITTVGWLSGYPVAYAFILPSNTLPIGVSETLRLVLMCGWVAVLQWLGLRDHFSSAGWWILVNAVGGAVGALIFYLVLKDWITTEYAANAILIGLGRGAALGLGLATLTTYGLFFWLKPKNI